MDTILKKNPAIQKLCCIKSFNKRSNEYSQFRRYIFLLDKRASTVLNIVESFRFFSFWFDWDILPQALGLF